MHSSTTAHMGLAVVLCGFAMSIGCGEVNRTVSKVAVETQTTSAPRPCPLEFSAPEYGETLRPKDVLRSDSSGVLRLMELDEHYVQETVQGKSGSFSTVTILRHRESPDQLGATRRVTCSDLSELPGGRLKTQMAVPLEISFQDGSIDMMFISRSKAIAETYGETQVLDFERAPPTYRLRSLQALARSARILGMSLRLSWLVPGQVLEFYLSRDQEDEASKSVSSFRAVYELIP